MCITAAAETRPYPILWDLKQRFTSCDSLLDGLGVRAGDGVAIEEREELAESVEEGPVGEQADALVGVDRALGCGAVGGRRRGVGGGGGGFVRIWAQEAQLRPLLISQTLVRVGLVELNGGTVDLQEGSSCVRPVTEQGGGL